MAAAVPCAKMIYRPCKHAKCTYYNEQALFSCLRQTTLRNQPVKAGEIAKWMGKTEQQILHTLAEAKKNMRKMILGTIKFED